MSRETSKRVWQARVDPRRQTPSVGIYSHVRDNWGISYAQPIVLNERQAGAAIEGVVRDERLETAQLAVDTHGSLCWPAGEFDGQPLLVITSEKCAAEYLDMLAGAGISWIAVGEERIDLPEAMEMLRETFGVERLAVVTQFKV